MPIIASAAGVGAVYLGRQLAGMAGATGGALVGLLFGRSLEADAKAQQKAAIASAEELFKSALETAQKVAGRGYIFFRADAVLEEPDLTLAEIRPGSAARAE